MDIKMFSASGSAHVSLQIVAGVDTVTPKTGLGLNFGLTLRHRHRLYSHGRHFPGCNSYNPMGCDTLIIITPLPVYSMCHPLLPVQCFVTPTVTYFSLKDGDATPFGQQDEKSSNTEHI